MVVVPDYDPNKEEECTKLYVSGVLRVLFGSSLNNYYSIAIPLLGTGVRNWPLSKAIPLLLDTILFYMSTVEYWLVKNSIAPNTFYYDAANNQYNFKGDCYRPLTDIRVVFNYEQDETKKQELKKMFEEHSQALPRRFNLYNPHRDLTPFGRALVSLEPYVHSIQNELREHIASYSYSEVDLTSQNNQQSENEQQKETEIQKEKRRTFGKRRTSSTERKKKEKLEPTGNSNSSK